MTDKHIEGLKTYNENLNKVVKESLQTALVLTMQHQDFSKISITDLCKKAGVSRMAFYSNYKTLDSLLESVVREYNSELVVDLVSSPVRRVATLDWYFKLFNKIKANVNFFKTLFNAGFRDKYLSIINNLVLQLEGMTSSRKYARIIWAGGIVNIIINWIDNDLDEPVESIAKLCYENMVEYV